MAGYRRSAGHGPNKALLIRRGAASALGLLLAWQVLASGIDDIVSQNGSAAALCTGICGTNETNLAQAAIQRGDAAEGAAYARQAIARAPLNQRAVTLLAVAGEPAQVVPLMTLSAALGWRDRLTSLWLIRAAGDAGDAALFAQRFDSLSRQLGDPSEAAGLLDSRIGDPAIRAAIVDRMTLPSRWRSVYLGSLKAASPPLIAARLALLRELAATAAPPQRTELAPYVRRLEQAGQKAAAYAVWHEFVAQPDAWAGKLYDGGFERVGGAGDYPYEWSIQNVPGAFATVDDGSAAELYVHNDGGAAGQFATQTLALKPGRYRLDVRASDHGRGGTGDDAPGVGWSVTCADGRNLIDQVDRDGVAVAGTGRRGYTFLVPAGCAMQTLSLDAVVSRAGMPSDLWIQRVRLDPAADAPPAAE